MGRVAMRKHPIQPLEMVNGVLRFKQNKIVRHLLDHGGLTMNDLAIVDFPRDDLQHFAQLIGYSHSGYCSLSYATDRVYETAMKRYEARKESGDAAK